MNTCGIKMEESYKIPEFCVKAQMCQAALALDKERAALGMQVLYFQFAFSSDFLIHKAFTIKVTL